MMQQQKINLWWILIIYGTKLDLMQAKQIKSLEN